jgi:hypothetical protein
MVKRVRLFVIAVALSGLVAGVLIAPAASRTLASNKRIDYRKIANLTGPGAPGGSRFGLVSDLVFVDPARHRVLLSDDSNTFGGITGEVDAWSTVTNAFVGGMSGGFTGVTGFPGSFDQLGPSGVLVDDHGRIWAGNGDGTVKVGLESSMTEIASVSTGSTHRADEIAFDPVHQRILVTNPSESPPFVTVIDASSGPPFKVLAHISLGKQVPTDSIEQPQFDPLTGRFLVSVRKAVPGDKRGEVAVVNPVTLRVEKLLRLRANCNPAGMALGPAGDVLLGCDSAPPVIIDRRSGKPDTLRFGPFATSCCADEVWFNPGDGRYYVADAGTPDGKGTNPVVTVIDARTLDVVAEIPIRNSKGKPDPAFHAVAVDPNTNHVFVPTSEGVQVFAASGGR